MRQAPHFAGPHGVSHAFQLSHRRGTCTPERRWLEQACGGLCSPLGHPGRRPRSGRLGASGSFTSPSTVMPASRRDPVADAHRDARGDAAAADSARRDASDGAIDDGRAPAPTVSGDLDFGAVNCGATAVPGSVSIQNPASVPLAFGVSLGRGAASPYFISVSSGVVPARGMATLVVAPRAIPAVSDIPVRTATRSRSPPTRPPTGRTLSSSRRSPRGRSSRLTR